MYGNEHESSPPLSLDYHFKIVAYDGYVKYEAAEIQGSAIMQDSRDSVKKIIIKKIIKKWSTGSHFGFFSVKFVMGYPRVRHYILFYIHGPVILHFLS